MDKFYTPQPDGLIGNEDCGQMSAWYVLSAAGFYPVTPGSTLYAIGTPLFPETRFHFENGKQFVIKANGVSATNIYIQSATLNGKAYRKPFLLSLTLMATGTFHKIPHNWSIKLLSKYNRQYTGGGDLALIDGIRGRTNFSDGAWQGYQGQELVAVVDLGKTQTVSKLGAGFLQEIGS